jgi:hypothetical protein
MGEPFGLNEIREIEDARFLATLDKMLGEELPSAEFCTSVASLLNLNVDVMLHTLRSLDALSAFTEEQLKAQTGHAIRDAGRLFEQRRRQHNVPLSAAKAHLRAFVSKVCP